MCFAHSKSDLTPYYDEEDGSVHEENSNQMIVIPETVHQHVDNPLLNFEVQSEDSILGFVYEQGNEIFIVWTSDEAIALYNEPFNEIALLL